MHVCIFVCVSASKLSLRFISFNYLKIGKMEQCEGRKRIFTGVGGGLSRGSRVRRAGSEDPPRRQQKLLSQSKIERAYFSSNSSNTHPLPQRCKKYPNLQKCWDFHGITENFGTISRARA